MSLVGRHYLFSSRFSSAFPELFPDAGREAFHDRGRRFHIVQAVRPSVVPFQIVQEILLGKGQLQVVCR